jgi:hypothetical protein
MPLSKDELARLRNEALVADDFDMADMADRALSGDPSAGAICELLVQAARRAGAPLSTKVANCAVCGALAACLVSIRLMCEACAAGALAETIIKEPP